MIKKILVSSFIFLSLHTFAQEGTASPYSFYGIGDNKFKGTIENKSMGGLSVLPDSIHINLQNPATLSNLKFTTFTIAGSSISSTMKNNTTSEKSQRTSLDYLAMAFPVGKLGFSFGLLPYSSVGYKIKNTDADGVEKRFSGTGGINKVFAETSYKLNSKFNIGVDLSYNFGQIEKSATKIIPGVQYGSRDLSIANLTGLSLNTGIVFNSKYNKYNVTSSATFSPAANLTSKNTSNLAAITYTSSGVERVWSSNEYTLANSKLKLPAKLTFGAGIGDYKKWFAGFESSFSGKTDLGAIFANITSENASRLSFGGYYTPNFNSYSNYLKRITYRSGFRFENTGLSINSETINETAFTLGLGLPIGGSYSNINVGLELGKKGTMKSNLIQENYINLSIGLSFNDRWFVKRKFD